MAAITVVKRWKRSDAIHRLLFDTGLDPSISVRLFEELLILAGKATVLYWKEKILPRHFERSAHGRYGYHKRKKWYIKYKTRRWPDSGGLDLIMSGYLKERALGVPRTAPTGRAVQKPILGFRFKIGIMTTEYAAKNKYVDIHSELTREDAQDALEVWNVLKGHVERLLFGLAS